MSERECAWCGEARSFGELIRTIAGPKCESGCGSQLPAVDEEYSRLVNELTGNPGIPGVSPASVIVHRSYWTSTIVPVRRIWDELNPVVIRYQDRHAWILHPRIMEAVRPHLSLAARRSLGQYGGWLGHVRGPAYLAAVTGTGIAPAPVTEHHVYLTGPGGIIGERLVYRSAEPFAERYGPDRIWFAVDGEIVPFADTDWLVPPGGITAREWRIVRLARGAA